ncbi:pyridoxamine 5'-phosphate oxidase [Pantoea sp. Mhis]|uniref:pyridoxamine 5'-phosphate oxidase n=1 Tax=Pantoea sp. Mhis TaxID=2576759 RepID=UPI001357C8D3|nr:pyridoxamine 5'-phosphate oxidase [Pantoea sp. Mhis]MXP56203.1 pyridoxamine 5'-phosphate oxidase [Pantoea sp. Mhis]
MNEININNNIIKNVAYIRREYNRGTLNRKDLPNNPLVLFEQWLHQACLSNISDSTAMILSTVDNNGQPYQRTVLLKDYDEKGMVFFTNLSSRKALQLGNNPRVSLHFPWHSLDRQVIILGTVEKLPPLEISKYFYSRPRNSQIATWASRQSSVLSKRNILEAEFIRFKKKFNKSKIPLPNFWGGYCVKYFSIEFWQGGKYRLHDRFIYQIQENCSWFITRLFP